MTYICLCFSIIDIEGKEYLFHLAFVCSNRLTFTASVINSIQLKLLQQLHKCLSYSSLTFPLNYYINK